MTPPEVDPETDGQAPRTARAAPGPESEDAYFPRPLQVSTHEAEFPIFHALVEQLASDDPLHRGSACWALGQLRYQPAIRSLGRLLSKDSDALVRMQAAQALACMKSSASTQALIRGLKDDDELVRDSCILGIGSARDLQGQYPLEEMRRRLGDRDPALARRLDWAIGVLEAVEQPGTRPDRRRGGVSKKISRYLDKVHEAPRSGIAHNNLAVAYFHAAEYDLAVRHCHLAQELGARVEWLWKALVGVGYDPAAHGLSDEDRAFIERQDPDSEALRLEPEPQRIDLAGTRAAPEGDDPPGPGDEASRAPGGEPAEDPGEASSGGDRDDRERRGKGRR